MKANAFLIGIACLLGMLWSVPANADPCKGELPKAGTHFSGTVRYVGDGDGVCVGPAGHPEKWIEVRLGDYYAPELRDRGGVEAKRQLVRLVMGRVISCRAGAQSYDRVIGYCTLGGQTLGSLLKRSGGTEGGRGWRRLRMGIPR